MPLRTELGWIRKAHPDWRSGRSDGTGPTFRMSRIGFPHIFQCAHKSGFARCVGGIDLTCRRGNRIRRWGSRKLTAESLRRIDLAQLRREHPLTVRSVAHVAYERGGEEIKATIYFAETKTHFGGRRHLFARREAADVESRHNGLVGVAPADGTAEAPA
jgi:hypothetical protein